MIKCNKCGGELADNAKFCIFCGMPVEREKVCERCDTVNAPVARFCIECGNPLTVNVAESKARQSAFAIVDSVVKIVSWCLAGGLALMSLIFLLVSGIAYEGSTLLGVAMPVGESNIFELISFDKILNLIESWGSNESSFEKNIIFDQLIVQCSITLAGLGAMIAMLVMVIIAIVKWIKLSKIRNIDVGSISIKMFLTFFVAVNFIAGMSALSVEARATSGVYSQTISGGMGLSGATNAGIVLGFILMSLYLACRIFLNRKEFKAKRIVLTSFVGVAFVLACVLVSQIGSGIYHGEVEIPISSTSSGQGTGRIVVGFMTILTVVLERGGPEGFNLWSSMGAGVSLITMLLLLIIGVCLLRAVDGKKSIDYALACAVLGAIGAIGYCIIGEGSKSLVAQAFSEEVVCGSNGITLVVVWIVMLIAVIVAVVLDVNIRNDKLKASTQNLKI